jgi:hypothetical protein
VAKRTPEIAAHSENSRGEMTGIINESQFLKTADYHRKKDIKSRRIRIFAEISCLPAGRLSEKLIFVEKLRDRSAYEAIFRYKNQFRVKFQENLNLRRFY